MLSGIRKQVFSRELVAQIYLRGELRTTVVDIAITDQFAIPSYTLLSWSVAYNNSADVSICNILILISFFLWMKRSPKRSPKELFLF